MSSAERTGRSKSDPSRESSKIKSKTSKKDPYTAKTKSKDSSRPKTSKSKDSKKPRKEETPDDSGGQASILNLYCAIYTPHFGNYYHWAFAVSDLAGVDWHIFEVVQDVQDGPFTPAHRMVNPMNSRRCRQPLIYLGQLHVGWWETLVNNIYEMRPGEALSWNCQDYVMEIWDMMCSVGMIEQSTWQYGRAAMMPYYGQDFGDDGDEEDDTYEEGHDEEQSGRRILSEEFVLDSSE
ncbi:hypothetical protein K4F52_010269 [Lecanicillium sp. MT-2017a]|nr:hypothetical protein K4F52_010269 [Lecanicillium sp. MT-2017a]